MKPAHPMALSIDLDEWFHGRWATGGPRSRWADTASVFREVYGGDRPRGDIVPAARWLLALFAERRITATFFILGEVAEWYPELVREIAAAGHEIACHGMHHTDMTTLSREAFTADLRRAKELLEKLAGRPVRGYRAPNLVVAPWLADVIRELGFTYDSSICPARSFSGKYQDMMRCPQHPYRTGAKVQDTGNGPLWEIPIPTFPLLRLPAGTGIATRLFGAWWTRLALAWWARTGSVQFYFHPYEIWNDPLPAGTGWKTRLFMKSRGRTMQRRTAGILDAYRGRITSLSGLLEKLERAD